MKYEAPDATLFRRNRQRFVAAMKPNTIAVFISNDTVPRSADAHYFWRQNPDLYYLSGIDQEQTFLLLYPDCPNPKQREVLFIRKSNETLAVWEGHKYTKEEARTQSGVDNVQYSDQFPSIFHILAGYASGIYLNLNDHDRAPRHAHYPELNFAKEIQSLYPLHSFERSAPIMHRLRAIKHESEIAILRKACQITRDAFQRVLKFVKPGVGEYEIEAEIIHEFIRQRATGHAYTPIIASGKNACILHYIDNNQRCKAGELILMDFGAEYGNYCADLSRTIPVSGVFSDRQKEVYQSVYYVLQYAQTRLVAGNTLEEYHREVGQAMEVELIKLGLLNEEEVRKQSPEQPLYKKYFMHGTSHYLGLDVHDVGSRYATIEAGMVLTCEPGIYIPEEGLGIRLENDIWITESGNVNLMADIPLEWQAIEAAMAETVSA